MERVYGISGKSIKQAVRRINLADHDWSETEWTALELCKRALSHQITVAHSDLSQRICVYTDSSDLAWSGSITEVPPADDLLPHVEQSHSPLSLCR